MQLPKDIDSITAYLRAWAPELGERIVRTYPPLHGFDDAASPLTGQLLRKPFPAQTLAMMGVVKRWNEARGAAVIAEGGTGKTLISLGAVHVHSDPKPFTALAIVPPPLVEKCAREAFQSLPGPGGRGWTGTALRRLQEGKAERNPRRTEWRRIQEIAAGIVQCVVAGGRKESPTFRSCGFHRPLHAGLLRLRHCG